MSRKLLVPLDGSKLGEAVLPWASALARETQSALLLVRVVSGRRYAIEYWAIDVHKQHITPEWRDAETYLAEAKRRMEQEGLSVQTTVRGGLIAENILDVADEEGVSAIVLSTHGRRGMARFFLGSVAESLVHETRIPLFLVPPDAARRGREPSFARILVPLDGSALAEQALEYVADVAHPDATTILVRIVSPDEIEADVPNASLVAADAKRDEASARKYLQGIAQQIHGIGRRAQIMTITGQPAREILIAAKAAHADAIVMVSHGRTGPGRWRLGSVADEVIRHGDIPVFLISARALAALSSTRLVASDVMTRSPVLLGSADTVAVALRKMVRQDAQSAVVVDDLGRLIGMLSQHDLGAWADRQGASDVGWSLDLVRRAEEETIAGLLPSESLTLDETTSLRSALSVMIEQRLDSAAVTKADDVVGVLTLQATLDTLISGGQARGEPAPVPAEADHPEAAVTHGS